MYLGSLGEATPPLAPPIGGHVVVASEILVGRAEACAICLRQGPHSDQNTVARRHARIERLESGPAAGVRVTDLQSTIGTFVRGALVRAPTDAAPGDQVAFAATHRFRVDGA